MLEAKKKTSIWSLQAETIEHDKQNLETRRRTITNVYSKSAQDEKLWPGNDSLRGKLEAIEWMLISMDDAGLIKDKKARKFIDTDPIK